MNLIRQLMIRADDAAAFLWARASQADRASLCARARLSDSITLLDWYELQSHERWPILRAITAEIETNASLQRRTTIQQPGEATA